VDDSFRRELEQKMMGNFGTGASLEGNSLDLPV
jgi:hypothetical protein